MHALGGRVAALERAAGRKDTGTGKAAQQTLAAVDAQTDAVADAANAAVEEGVKDITALADVSYPVAQVLLFRPLPDLLSSAAPVVRSAAGLS